MKAKYKTIIAILLVLASIALITLFASTHNIAVLEPKGLIAEKERDLIITASILMLIVVIPVFIFTIYFAWKYRENNENARHEPDWEHNNIAEICWWGVPLVIVVILAVITWRTSHELNPFRPIETNKKPLEIQAVALDWKWLFIYPEQGIATVNFVQIPEHVPINFAITSDTVMNSFWIPQLGGQIYAMPAMRSKLHLIGHQQGSYRGSSANISGKGFAGMYFTAKVSTQEEFNQWVQSARKSSDRLDFAQYTQELVPPSEYNPVAIYVLTQQNLFDQILMKYEPRSQ